MAASFAAGIRANFGTMTKPLHAGHCSRNGLYAALMAKDGFTASHDAFEHAQGYFELFNGAGNYHVEKILANWANPLDVLSPGIGLKQYPCCASTHSAIDAALVLRERHQLTPARIAKIENICGLKCSRPLDHYAQVQKLVGDSIVMRIAERILARRAP